MSWFDFSWNSSTDTSTTASTTDTSGSAGFGSDSFSSDSDNFFDPNFGADLLQEADKGAVANDIGFQSSQISSDSLNINNFASLDSFGFDSSSASSFDTDVSSGHDLDGFGFNASFTNADNTFDFAPSISQALITPDFGSGVYTFGTTTPAVSMLTANNAEPAPTLTYGEQLLIDNPMPLEINTNMNLLALGTVTAGAAGAASAPLVLGSLAVMGIAEIAQRTDWSIGFGSWFGEEDALQSSPNRVVDGRIQTFAAPSDEELILTGTRPAPVSPEGLPDQLRF